MNQYSIDFDIVRLGESPLINAVVLVGFALVVPLALGRPWRGWLLAAASLALGLCAAPGLAVIAAVPAGLAVAGAWRNAGTLAIRLAVGWVAVAVGAIASSLAGRTLFGVGEPIVRLTAVHYLYAGVGALVIAERLRGATRFTRTELLAVVATAAAPPVVAIGFITRLPLPQVGGAVLMTVGVWSTAFLLGSTVSDRQGRRRILAAIAAAAAWAPMVLAVAWAASNHWLGVPALSIPEMARFHGVVNAVGFVVAGLLATRAASVAGQPTEPSVERSMQGVSA